MDKKFYFVSYMWMKEVKQSVVSINKPQQGSQVHQGQGWTAIDQHPFNWIEKCKGEGVMVFPFSFQQISEEEYELAKSLKMVGN